MTMTTVHSGSAAPLATRRTVAKSAERHAAASIAGLVGLGTVVALVGGLIAAAGVGLVVGAVSGTLAAVGAIGALGVTFLAIPVPTTCIWLVGAIQTPRTIRRVAPATEARDRAAFAELNVLLARE
jgi:hypothetical protein